MEAVEGRRRTTLSDQLSAAAALELPPSASKLAASSSSPNLRDLFKVRREEDLRQPPPARRRRSASISLGTFLACEKPELSSPGLTAVTPAGAIGGRTLLDIIRDEEEESGGGGTFYSGVVVGDGRRISWRSFRERLRIRRAGATWQSSGALSGNGVSAAAAGLPAQEDNPAPAVEPNRSSSARPNAGDAARTEPLPSPTQVDTARLPHGRVSAGEQAQGSNGGGNPPATATVAGEAAQQQQQMRVSLMALLEQTDGQVGGTGFAVSALLEGAEDEEEGEEERGGKALHQARCCVCMVRKKGAAFIPCGHTFCRLCSRQLWVSRGTCPLCNGFILEVLDIF